jgi:23S rRNA (guanosine2251-2'-O)-methyltransferase
MHDADLTGRIALLFGGEGEGLPPSLVAAADVTVSIPMSGAVESLNVSVAAAVMIYEARRQRHIDSAAASR